MSAPIPNRVAIVGCGYIGSALGRALLDEGCHVPGTTTSAGRADALRRLAIEPHVWTTDQPDRLRDVLVDCHAVAVCLAAGRGGDYRSVYVDGIDAVLRAIDGTGIRRVVYISSTRVYGQNDGSWVDESTPTAPGDEQSRSLLEAETRLLEGAGHMPNVTAAVLRLGGIYGPGRELTARIHAAAGTQRDDGDAFVNLVHRDDVVVALRALLAVEYSGVLNLCDDHPTLRRELYDRVLAESGLEPVQWIRSAGRQQRLGKRVRNDRIKHALGLRLVHPKFVPRT